MKITRSLAGWAAIGVAVLMGVRSYIYGPHAVTTFVGVLLLVLGVLQLRRR